MGQPEEFTWRAVVLRKRLGQRPLVPNSAVARGSVRVWSQGEPGAVVVRLGTAYGVDPLRVKAILEQVAVGISGVLPEPNRKFSWQRLGIRPCFGIAACGFSPLSAPPTSPMPSLPELGMP